MSDHSGSSIHRDIASAYLAAGARIASWIVVSAVVFRADPISFAMLALLRSTVGLLNYTTLGLGPAMIHSLARLRPARTALRALPVNESESPEPLAIPYAGTWVPRKMTDINEGLRTLLASGIAVSTVAAVVGLVLVFLYAAYFDRIHRVPGSLEGAPLAALMGIAMVIRLASDAPSAVLQTENRIVLDNCLVIAAEIVWVVVALITGIGRNTALSGAVFGFMISSVFLFYARFFAANRRTNLPAIFWRFFDLDTAKYLIKTGSLIGLAQLADFLYAPTDYILINRLLDPGALASYAPAVQIDAGLLVIVSGLAGVLLPKTAIAHAAGDIDAVRKYYFRGTFGSAAVLAIASVAVWLVSAQIFKIWLNDPMPATQAILPLVLIHTVIGGSSAVGRSILLGMGKVKPFTIAALVSGAINVVLSFAFVRFLHLGLRGIIYGTIIAVTLRCAVWMPWYVMRVIRRGQAPIEPVVAPAPADLIA